MNFLIETDYLPWCAKCDKYVDQLNQHHHVGSDDYVYTVFCHGDSEELFFTAREMEDMVGNIQPGVAFKTNPLLEGE